LPITNGARVIDSAPPAIASFHSRGAEAVDGRAGNGLRQAREQEGHAREVAVILACLIGAAEKDLVDFVAKARMTAHELADGQGREIIGAGVGERPAVAADRSAHIVADEGFGGHGLDVVGSIPAVPTRFRGGEIWCCMRSYFLGQNRVSS
jgi:hypothetical protein